MTDKYYYLLDFERNYQQGHFKHSGINSIYIAEYVTKQGKDEAIAFDFDETYFNRHKERLIKKTRDVYNRNQSIKMGRIVGIRRVTEKELAIKQELIS